jgi:protein O-mannosyl-transferase
MRSCKRLLRTPDPRYGDLPNGPPAASDGAALTKREWLFLAILVAAVFLAYQPAWNGGFIWDDDAHITRPSLRSWDGLYRIWFDVGATLQYYPLLHTTFWLEHQLWGDSAWAYHLANIAMHSLVTILAFVVLRRLQIPGAWLAAAIFALHPVHVESVAWITEQKNTLSAVFYLAAMLNYLRFDRTRTRSSYALSLALFVLAILTKTVMATLPGAVLVVFWWQRGRLSWKKDVLPLMPFFVLGAGGGLITAWWELQINQCVGPEFTFSFAQRLLIAGRTVCFCLGKLVWPTNLIFIYPRWHVDAWQWWQYAFPAGAAGLLGAAWLVRRWSRAPLAAILFFGGTLFPVMGFFNLYTYRYSFVADHYQYLASLGIIALGSAAVASWLARLQGWQRTIGRIISAMLLLTLAGLSWRQCHMYSDLETLYTTTLLRDPDCPMAHTNLGIILANSGRTQQAIAHYQAALKSDPRNVECYNNLGAIMNDRGDVADALPCFQKAIEIDPHYADSHRNLALALAACGQADEAIEHYELAIANKKFIVDRSECVSTLNNLGAALASRGRFGEAAARFRQAIRMTPDSAMAQKNLELTVAAQERLDQAKAQFRQTFSVERDPARAHYNLGCALAASNQIDEAVDHFRTALEAKPDEARIHNALGMTLLRCRRSNEAIPQLVKVLQLQPQFPDADANLLRALSSLTQPSKSSTLQRELIRMCPKSTDLLNEAAWILATCAEPTVANGEQAIELAERAVRLSDGQEPAFLDTLAAGYAQAGQFDKAVETAQKAADLAAQQNKKVFADAINARIKLYKKKQPFRQADAARM